MGKSCSVTVLFEWGPIILGLYNSDFYNFFFNYLGRIKVTEKKEHQGLHRNTGQHAQSDFLYNLVRGFTDVT